MTTKRKTGFTKMTLPNSPSSGVTVGFTLSFPLAGARVAAVTLPVRPCVNIASGPAAFFAEQLDQSTTSRATRINRTSAVNEFGGGTSTGKTRNHFLTFSRIFFQRLSQSAQLCAQASP